jgi:hypothetical protein
LDNIYSTEDYTLAEQLNSSFEKLSSISEKIYDDKVNTELSEITDWTSRNISDEKLLKILSAKIEDKYRNIVWEKVSKTSFSNRELLELKIPIILSDMPIDMQENFILCNINCLSNAVGFYDTRVLFNDNNPKQQQMIRKIFLELSKTNDNVFLALLKIAKPTYFSDSTKGFDENRLAVYIENFLVNVGTVSSEENFLKILKLISKTVPEKTTELLKKFLDINKDMILDPQNQKLIQEMKQKY